MRERLFILLALTFLASAFAEAQLPRPIIKERYDPKRKTQTALEVTPLLDQLPASGYYPIRIYINNDAKINRTWSFSFVSTDSDGAADGNELKSSVTVKCDAKSTTEADLTVPLVTIFRKGYDASINLEVSVQAPPALRNSRNTISTQYDTGWPSVMVSEELYSMNGNALSNSVSTSLSGGGGGPFRHGGSVGTMGLEFGAAFNPEKMSEDWRAYSGYDACLLTEEAWNDELSPGAKIALLKWNRMGGSLLIYSRNSSTDLASLNIDKERAGLRSSVLGWGAVQVKTLPNSGLLPADDTVALVRDTVNHSGGHRIKNLRNDFRPSWPLQIAFGSKTAHIVFFILVLVAFGILVGPVNLFVFARSGQRHKLFITTPLISLGASALLVVLILFQDGFGGRGYRLVLHEVGPDNTAYISQEQIARTGVLLNTGFTTSEHGYLSPVMLSNSRWARVTEDNEGGKGRYNVEMAENGLRVTGDWFQSRSEHGHVFDTTRPSRGRVSLVRGGSDPVINSTFEFPLAELYYIDPSGNLWHGSEVQQGRNTTLESVSTPLFDDWFRTGLGRFGPKNQVRLGLARVRKGQFFATTSEAPGINTLSAIDWKETYTFLTGKISPQ